MPDTVKQYKVPSDSRPVTTGPPANISDDEIQDFRFYKNAALGDLFANAFASNTGQNVNTVFRKLCREHPMISVDPQMLGGMPHVKGFRLSVGDILAKLYIHGDVDKVTAMFEPDLSKEHIKEAIAFAQDFLEEMSVPT